MNKIVILFLCLILITFSSNAADYKNTDLSGSWYPSIPFMLRSQINNYLKKAELPKINGDILGLICPHAGIVYSGATAAHCFKAIKDKEIDTVIIVGFSHKLSYDAIAVLDNDGIKSPLGVLEFDTQLIQELKSKNKKILSKPEAFKNENSVELLIPFVQVALGNPKVVLLAIGLQSYSNSQILGDALYEVLKDKSNYIIIASTDMSHYLPESVARKTDSDTKNQILKMNPEELYKKTYAKNRMCGTASVVAAMIATKKLGAQKAVVLDESTSSDSSNDKKRVVGYLSAAFVIETKRLNKKKEAKMQEVLSHEQKKKLLKLARETITRHIKKQKLIKSANDDPTLDEIMGVFVTLHKNHQLRGCIGNIIAREPLYKGVIDMAIASSTQDSRFRPVIEEELDDIDIEISVLTPLKKISDPSDIILGTHGVVVKDFFRSGVYLPQVATETGWELDKFMSSLCSQKAGMAEDAWKTGKCDIFVFSAEVFGEKDYQSSQ